MPRGFESRGKMLDRRRSRAPRGRKTLLVLGACAVLLLAAGVRRARADSNTAAGRPQVLRNVGIDQNLNQQIPLDLTFRDETGKPVELRQYFGKKPVVLSLVYFSCPMLCTMVEQNLLQALKQISFNIGDQYNVLTVSFDPHDTPEMASAKRDVYVGLYGRKDAKQGWHFLTGDEPSIQALTKAVGFRYTYDPQTGQYAHATAIMVLTPQGKLARYFYGIQYPPGGLRLSLVEASHEKIGSPVDAILLFCCSYDPATGKYGLLVSRLLMIAGGLTVVVIGTLLFMLSRSRRHAHA
jgi:protein SCO1/2